MFFDTAYNTRRTTLHNLHSAFAETAGKMWAYARCLPKAKRPRAELTISAFSLSLSLSLSVPFHSPP